VEAADNGLLAPELASGIARVKGVASKGVRVGNWLSLRQAQALLNAPDTATQKGLRDRAMLAVLLGCGLRRSEVAALTLKHIQQRDNRWCIVDLVGKHGRVRTIPMPTWAKMAIDAWTSAAFLSEGFVFRPVNRGDQVSGERLREKSFGSSFAGMQKLPASLALRRTTRVGHAPNCAAPRAANSNRSRCYWATRRFRPPSDISVQGRTWFMRPMMGSNCGYPCSLWWIYVRLDRPFCVLEIGNSKGPGCFVRLRLGDSPGHTPPAPAALAEACGTCGCFRDG
jgi:hypothetical protein